jgi:hypothetical protein
MIKNETRVSFYTEYRDKDGIVHHTVQTYNNADKTVDMFQDHAFKSSNKSSKIFS